MYAYYPVHAFEDEEVRVYCEFTGQNPGVIRAECVPPYSASLEIRGRTRGVSARAVLPMLVQSDGSFATAATTLLSGSVTTDRAGDRTATLETISGSWTDGGWRVNIAELLAPPNTLASTDCIHSSLPGSGGARPAIERLGFPYDI